MSELANSFDWAALGSGKVVDVGGGSGHVSFALAQVRTRIQPPDRSLLTERIAIPFTPTCRPGHIPSNAVPSTRGSRRPSFFSAA